MQASPYLVPKGKFNYDVPRDISISPARYFNHRLLNFNQCFVSDAEYIFFARSVYEQHQLRLSINFIIHKIKSSTVSAGMIRNNFKETIKRFVASANTFSFMSSVK